MSNLAMWSMVVGFFLPMVIAVIQQPSWSQQVRALVTFGVCVVAGAGTAYFNGDFNTADIASAILVTLVTAISVYKGLMGPTGIAPKIEAATSSSKSAE